MEVKALDTLRKHLAEPEPMETEETEESLKEREAELLKPSKGETIALWLDTAYSPAFKEKVLEIQKRYTSGEWEGKPVLRRKPEQTKKGLPFTSKGIPPAIAPEYKGTESGTTENALYEEGSFLWAVYPPLELLKDHPEELEMVELAEAIDTFLECAPEEEVQAFLSLEKGEA